VNRRPNFIIIGAMKCATSTLHEQLARQPGFFMSQPKEPNFFSDDSAYARGEDWYLGLFAGTRPGDICGESSTHYTKLPTYPGTVGMVKGLRCPCSGVLSAQREHGKIQNCDGGL
jgi:hypothetical protein